MPYVNAADAYVLEEEKKTPAADQLQYSDNGLPNTSARFQPNSTSFECFRRPACLVRERKRL